MTRASAIVPAAAAAALFLSLGAAQAEDDVFVDARTLTPEVALKAAQAAMQNCRDSGYQVAVAVVDRSGLTQVVLRDRFAGPHTVETAQRKAWTAVSFRTDTLTLDSQTRADGLSFGIRDLDRALALGGGIPVDADGSLVAGIGVSGAPSPEADDVCADEGLAAIEGLIAF